MSKCQVCGYDNPDDSKVCLNCGSPIESQPQGEAIDDISGEATVLIGMQMPKSPPPPPEDDDKPEPPPPAAPPPPPSSSGSGMPPPPPMAAPPPPPAAAPSPSSFSAPPPPPGGSSSSTPPAPPAPVAPAPGSPSMSSTTGGGSGNGMILGIAGIALGVFALIFSFCCPLLGVPLAIGGGVCGFLAMKDPGSKILGIVGLVLAGLSILLGVAGMILGAVINLSS